MARTLQIGHTGGMADSREHLARRVFRILRDCCLLNCLWGCPCGDCSGSTESLGSTNAIQVMGTRTAWIAPICMGRLFRTNETSEHSGIP